MELTHRYFIQFMLKNGIATVEQALNYCSAVSKDNIDTVLKLKTLIIEINREISKQYFKIVFIKCEVTAHTFIVCLSTKNDNISKMQIAFSEKEIEYFQVILKEIIDSPHRKISFIVCLNITSTLTCTYSRESGQEVLNRWIKGGYYVKHGDFIYLGPRLILEFTSYLRVNHPLCVCHLCSELVFTGRICGNCDKIYHSYCIDKYLQHQTCCSNCKEKWIESETFQNIFSENTPASQLMDEDEPGSSRRKQMRLH